MTMKSGAPPTSDTAAAAAWRLAQEASADAGIEVVEAHDAATSRQVASTLNAIWHGETDLVNIGLLVALAHAGNLVAVATRDGEPVGGAVGFCGPRGLPFHSHVVGLLPRSTGKGLGRAIKLYQRAWCLERDITTMTWTFDPLVARNAYFNLRRLGARAIHYHPDLYGVMNDAINAGQYTDRLLIRWDLATPPLPGGRGRPEPDLGAAHLAVGEAGRGPGRYLAPPTEGPDTALVTVPSDIEELRTTDPAAAQEWRLRTREAFTDLLARGWVVGDFTRAGHYVFHRERTP